MPTESEVKIAFGPSGLGEIRFLKENIKIVASAGEVYNIALDAVDERVPKKNKKNIYFALSEDETKLYSVRPWEGNHIYRFTGFNKNEDGVARIKIRKGRWNQWKKWEPDRLQCTAQLLVTEGEFEGYYIPVTMDYVFVAGTGGACKLQSRRSKSLARVESFLDVAGFNRMQEEIPYSENVLPALEETLLTRAPKNRGLVLMENGWANQLSRLPTGL